MEVVSTFVEVSPVFSQISRRGAMRAGDATREYKDFGMSNNGASRPDKKGIGFRSKRSVLSSCTGLARPKGVDEEKTTRGEDIHVSAGCSPCFGAMLTPCHFLLLSQQRIGIEITNEPTTKTNDIHDSSSSTFRAFEFSPIQAVGFPVCCIGAFLLDRGTAGTGTLYSGTGSGRVHRAVSGRCRCGSFARTSRGSSGLEFVRGLVC